MFSTPLPGDWLDTLSLPMPTPSHTLPSVTLFGVPNASVAVTELSQSFGFSTATVLPLIPPPVDAGVLTLSDGRTPTLGRLTYGPGGSDGTNDVVLVGTGAKAVTPGVCGSSNMAVHPTQSLCIACPLHSTCNASYPYPVARPGYAGVGDGTVFVSCVNCVGSGFCREGAAGDLCGTCLDGFYPDRTGLCTRCPPFDQRAVNAFGLFALFICLVFLKMWLASLAVAHNAIQILGVFAKFDLAWPPVLLSLFTVFSAFSFDLDLLMLDCQFPTYSIAALTLIKATVPLFFGLLWAVTFAVSLACHALICTASRGATVTPSSPRSSLPRSLMARAGLDRFVATFVVLLNILYMSQAISVSDVFRCVEKEDGRFVLVSHESIRCYVSEGPWADAALVALGTGLVYLAGIPGLYGLILTRHREHLDSEAFRRRYGVMCYKYDRDFTKWELVIFARKVCITAISAVFPVGEIWKACAGILMFLGFGLCQVFAHPFVSQALDVLETQGMGLSFLLLTLGLVFASDAMTEGEFSSVLGLAVVALVVSVGVIIVVVAFDVQSHLSRYAKRLAFVATNILLSPGPSQDLVSGDEDGGLPLEELAGGGRRGRTGMPFILEATLHPEALELVPDLQSGLRKQVLSILKALHTMQLHEDAILNARTAYDASAVAAGLGREEGRAGSDMGSLSLSRTSRAALRTISFVSSVILSSMGPTRISYADPSSGSGGATTALLQQLVFTGGGSGGGVGGGGGRGGVDGKGLSATRTPAKGILLVETPFSDPNVAASGASPSVAAPLGKAGGSLAVLKQASIARYDSSGLSASIRSPAVIPSASTLPKI